MHKQHSRAMMMRIQREPLDDNNGKPMRFVYRDDNGKLKMNPEAFDALKRIKGPIGVVSVCGPARQGKSFILNQILGKSSGFQLASTGRPCTKGLWIWSAPLKTTAPDGTQYSILLMDTEGIDAYDQTEQSSTQLLSLAVLLSSMFIYNQMGSIDDASLDRLAFITEMTKLIQTRATCGNDKASELGHFSPIFVWLMRDFYLDLMEDNAKMTPKDYLEKALRTVLCGGEEETAKNLIRDSVRALFPVRECFTLVCPMNNETDLQHLDLISMEKFRPEFQYRLDALKKYVFERTRPKQVGGTSMTGTILAGLVKSFLDAFNNGAVPTILFSWQSVEELECRRAYDIAAEVYLAAFDCTKPAEEVSIREAHDEAVQKSVVAFNESAVGASSARQNYEGLLRNFFTKALEGYKRNAFMEADLKCLNAIQSMDKQLIAACQVPDANIDHVVRVVDGLISQYEASIHGPTKWQMLSNFLRKSLQDVLLNQAKKQIDHVLSEKTTLMLNYRSSEDKVEFLDKQLEASKKLNGEYQKHYEDAIDDIKKLSDHYKNRITNLESKCSSLEERCSCLNQTVESLRQGSLDWKRKYEELYTKKNADTDNVNAELAVVRSRSKAAEAKIGAAHEKFLSTRKEANEWKDKYDIALRDAKAAMQRCKENEAEIGAAHEKILSAQKEGNEWKDKYDVALRDAKAAMQRSKENEAEIGTAHEKILSVQKEANEWKDKYDVALRDAKAAMQTSKENEAEIGAAHEKILSAEKEANEWKDKYDVALRDAKAVMQKATIAEESLNALRVEFTSSLAEKEEETKNKIARLTSAEQSLTNMSLELKAAESKIEYCEYESSDLKVKIRELSEMNELLKREANLLVQDRNKLEQQYISEQKRFEEVNIKCEVAEKEFKIAQSEVSATQNEKNDFEQLALERLVQIERAQKYIDSLERQKLEIASEIEQYRVARDDAISRIASLEAGVKERENEIKSSLVQEMTQLKQQYLSEKKQFEEVYKMCEVAEQELKTLKVEILATQNEKNEFQQLALQRLAQVESVQKLTENLRRQNMNMASEIDEYKCKVASLAARLKDSEQMIQTLLKINNQPRVSSILGSASESKYAAHAEANVVGKASSNEVELIHRDVNLLQHNVTSNCFNDTALNSQSATFSCGKRSRLDSGEGFDRVQDIGIDEDMVSCKRAKRAMTPRKCTKTEVQNTLVSVNEEKSESPKVVGSGDYTKLTVVKLRQELMKHGFGAKLLELRSPKKKDILALYKKHVLESEQ